LKQAIAGDPAQLDDRAQVASFYIEALRALAALDAEEAERAARKFLGYDMPALQKEGILLLSARPEGARFVAEQFLAKKLPAELRSQVVAGLRRHADKDKELAKLLEELTRESK
jgi:hypothetical protein